MFSLRFIANYETFEANMALNLSLTVLDEKLSSAVIVFCSGMSSENLKVGGGSLQL